MKDKVCLPTSDTDDMTENHYILLVYIGIQNWRLDIFMFTILELSEHSDIGNDGRDPIK